MSASGTSPSAAEEALSTTGEKANFQRLTRLLMRGGLPLLREVFDSIHPRGSLPDVLRDNKVLLENLRTPTGNKVFSFAEWKCLYKPRGPRTYGESAEFDITILYKLLPSICSLTTPETGWNELPNSTDDSREADIVRIRYYRNTIYSHNRLMEVTDANFYKLWMEIRDTLLRIAGGISSAKKNEWKKAIEKLFHEPLTPDAEKCVDELQYWYLMDMETKHTLDQMQKQIEQLHWKLDIFIAAILLEPSNSAPEVEGAQSSSESVETRISIPQEQPSAEGTTGQSTSRELPASQQNDTEVQNLWDHVCSSKCPLNRLKNYLEKKFGANVQGDRRGSLIITVSCSSLEVLEELWEEYRTGHLNEVIQATLVTAEVLEKLNLKEVKLRTIISEEDYLSYKKFLNKSAGNAVKLN